MDYNFDSRAALKAAYDNSPVQDHDRVDTAEHCGRDVIVECPAAWPRDARTDTDVKLPLRVVWDGGMGVGIDIGPYDFDAKSIHMLKQVITAFERAGGETWSQKFQHHTNGPAGRTDARDAQ